MISEPCCLSGSSLHSYKLRKKAAEFGGGIQYLLEAGVCYYSPLSFSQTAAHASPPEYIGGGVIEAVLW